MHAHTWQNRIYFETDDLVKYFEQQKHANTLPSLEDLLKVARTLYERYMTRLAYDAALTGDIAGLGLPKSQNAWVNPAGPTAMLQEGPMFGGDRTLAQSILFMIQMGLSQMVDRAVSIGDIGRVYEGLKVSEGYYGYMTQTHLDYISLEPGYDVPLCRLKPYKVLRVHPGDDRNVGTRVNGGVTPIIPPELACESLGGAREASGGRSNARAPQSCTRGSCQKKWE